MIHGLLLALLLVGSPQTGAYKVSGTVVRDDNHDLLMGTAATVAAAITAGAHIVRVHDVRQMRVLADMLDLISTA